MPPIDLDALFGGTDDDEIIEPVPLFKSLVRQPRYESLRGDQQSILERWWDSRREKDTVLKMNTGSGKTIVGLLMALSTMREEGGPALYLCPNRQLVAQAMKEGIALGIPVVTDKARSALPEDFLNGESILITTFHKVFYAGSPFGTASDRTPIIPSIVVFDDAHACLNAAVEQTSIVLPRKMGGVNQVVARLLPALHAQSIGIAADVKAGRKGEFVAVPYWAWRDVLPQFAELVGGEAAKERPRDAPKKLKNRGYRYKWPLVRNMLPNTTAFVGGTRIEVAPDVVPTEVAPTLCHAQRRIFMTATLADDTLLATAMSVGAKALESALHPTSRGDMGERLIVPTHLIDPGLNVTKIAQFAAETAKDGNNVVVLVPSFLEGEIWKRAGATVADNDTIQDTVDGLKKSKGKFVVLANRYDGVDLPNDACRLLIMHGLPRPHSFAERHSMSSRITSKYTRARVAQMVEQGLGRAVRSASDYAAVLLVGRDLNEFVSDKRRLTMFSSETASQIEMGRKLAKAYAAVGGVEAVRQVCALSWKRDKKWRRIHQDKLVRAPRPTFDRDRAGMAVAERQAYNLAQANQYHDAAVALRNALNTYAVDQTEQGWFLQRAAKHMDATDPLAALELQVRAHQLNRQLLKPREGTRYQRLARRSGSQGHAVLRWLSERTDANAPIVAFEEALKDIRYGVPHRQCEASFCRLAALLGIPSSRPEDEVGDGPDVLMMLGGGKAMVLEVKNMVFESRDFVSKSEVGQVGIALNWFRDTYGELDVVPALFHPSRNLNFDAHAVERLVVMDETRRERLGAAVRRFAASLASRAPDAWTAEEIAERLVGAGLTDRQFVNYFVPARRIPKAK